MATILITGASRGLGLEFAAQYARAGWRVHATCRDPAAADALNAVAAGAPSTVALHRIAPRHLRIGLSHRRLNARLRLTGINQHLCCEVPEVVDLQLRDAKGLDPL